MDCGAFDSGLCIHPDGKVSPCCLIDTEYFKDFDELDFNEPWRDLRDGRGCAACKHPGPIYKDSFNRFKNDTYAVRHLDVRNNNLCNLECSICNSYYSSKWAERMGDTKFVTSDFDISFDNLQHIYFAGGEPLLNPKHWEILRNVKNPANITLSYNSNLAHIKGIEEYWPRFKEVKVNASMDAVGELGEFLRYGTKWDKWVDNLHKTAEYATVVLNPTISVLNIFHLKDIEEWSEYPITYNILENPEHLCVSVLPAELKDKIEYIPDDGYLKYLLRKDESWLFPHTMSYILLQDKIKNTDIWGYLPFEKYAIQEYMENGL